MEKFNIPTLGVLLQNQADAILEQLDEQSREAIDALLMNPDTRSATEQIFCDYAARIPSVEAQGLQAEVDAMRETFLGALTELVEGEGTLEAEMRSHASVVCEKARTSPQR